MPLTENPSQPLDVPQTDDPDAWVRFWLDSALRCNDFHWDPDQYVCAEQALIAATAKAKGGAA